MTHYPPVIPYYPPVELKDLTEDETDRVGGMWAAVVGGTWSEYDGQSTASEGECQWLLK